MDWSEILAWVVIAALGAGSWVRFHRWNRELDRITVAHAQRQGALDAQAQAQTLRELVIGVTERELRAQAGAQSTREIVIGLRERELDIRESWLLRSVARMRTPSASRPPWLMVADHDVDQGGPLPLPEPAETLSAIAALPILAGTVAELVVDEDGRLTAVPHPGGEPR